MSQACSAVTAASCPAGPGATAQFYRSVILPLPRPILSALAALPTLLIFFFSQRQIVESIKNAGFK